MPAATIQTLMDRAAKKRAGQNALPSLGAAPAREKGNEEQGTELLAYEAWLVGFCTPNPSILLVNQDSQKQPAILHHH